MSLLFGSAGMLSIPPPSGAALARPPGVQDVGTRSRSERHPAEQTARALPKAQQHTGSTVDREAHPQDGPAFFYTAQLLTQATRPTDRRSAPPHPNISARASDAYRRAGAEPSAYPSEATVFRVAV